MKSGAQRIALRHEPSAARHIPYAAHVAGNLVKTTAGEYVQSFRLSGASFESADDADLNNWHERLNVTWRNIASPNVALWTHTVRRRERAVPGDSAGNGFADRLAAKYQQRLVGETLMVNHLYVSVVYRPVMGAASGLAARLLCPSGKGA
jgi:type IV secretion system protein VirB4